MGVQRVGRQREPRFAPRATPAPPARAAGGVVGSLLRLQRSAGNRAVAALEAWSQADLDVGPVGDSYEREADHVADRVVHQLGAEANGHTDVVRRTPAPAGGRGGQPLDATTRRDMEAAFGADLGGVRLHSGPAATALNDAVHARAFTVGSDIFFRDRAPDRRSRSDDRLLAHELAHTLQQAPPGPTVVRRQIKPQKAERKFTAELAKYPNAPTMTQAQRERVRDIAARADTTDDNVLDKVRTDAVLGPVLRELRMTLKPGRERNVSTQPDEVQRTYATIRAMTFYHGTHKEYTSSIRVSGLDPNHGGKAGGASAEQSLAGKKAQNIAESKNRVFVTRRFSEAHSYVTDGGGAVLRCFIPRAQRDRLVLDPRSQDGFFCEELIRFVDNPDGQVQTAVIDLAAEEAGLDRRIVREAYAWLLCNNAFEAREMQYEPPEERVLTNAS